MIMMAAFWGAAVVALLPALMAVASLVVVAMMTAGRLIVVALLLLLLLLAVEAEFGLGGLAGARPITDPRLSFCVAGVCARASVSDPAGERGRGKEGGACCLAVGILRLGLRILLPWLGSAVAAAAVAAAAAATPSCSGI